MPRQPTRQTATRLPEGLLARLDDFAGRMTRDSPGMTVTRTDVVRMLLVRGLENMTPPKRGNRDESTNSTVVAKQSS